MRKIISLASIIACFSGPIWAYADTLDNLDTVAESYQMLWNGVAIQNNEVYVSGPLWSGSKGPSVAKIGENGELKPYPSKAWNSTNSEVPLSKRFVNVNAIHKDDRGQLWIVDTGVSTFGGSVIKDAAKLVVVNLQSDKVSDVILFSPSVLKTNSYVDDIRFNGDYAYLTDAGAPGLIVLNLKTKKMWRVLDNSPSTVALKNRDIFLDGKVVEVMKGQPLRVNSDPLALSPDKKWLYFAPLQGPWSKVETRYLNDFGMKDDIQSKVHSWFNLPPVGGVAMGKDGIMYFTDLAANALRTISPEGQITTLVVDPRLHWADAPVIDKGSVYLPAFQVDRIATFNEGVSRVEFPIGLYKFDLRQPK
ncbi:L-dopachrome tautomerase-related protein [Vibrio mediterranei]|uniref:L-dopachrome tautomerase-related protein n=1 Tax=Vibrio mediterranei TaxID=689 RepID=UPI00148E5C43|nr:L-dopachrome tautomerase-related protein [Vibrio mediterranei]